MKKTITFIAVAFMTLSMSGCGTPSKEDTCGGCVDAVKAQCESTYDICDGNGDCIDALKQACG